MIWGALGKKQENSSAGWPGKKTQHKFSAWELVCPLNKKLFLDLELII